MDGLRERLTLALADTLLPERFLELDFFFPDAMCFVPVQLSPTNRTIRKSNRRDSLHLAPLACSVLSVESPSISDAASGCDDVNVLNSSDQFEAHARSLADSHLSAKVSSI